MDKLSQNLKVCVFDVDKDDEFLFGIEISSDKVQVFTPFGESRSFQKWMNSCIPSMSILFQVASDKLKNED